jgi:hypothetical protein
MKKTPTIFKRDIVNMKLVSAQINPVCQWVFDGEGVATRKYDGTCCLVQNGKLYKRRELREGDVVPDGFIQADFDPTTNKAVGWLPVTEIDPADQYHCLAFYKYPYVLSDGTYELLGPKIQGNPEGLEDYHLLKHSDAEVYDAPCDYAALSQWLADRDIEGLVFHHPDGRMAKIKKRDFNLPRSTITVQD